MPSRKGSRFLTQIVCMSKLSHMFMAYLLCIRHCAGHWESSSEQKDMTLGLQGLYIFQFSVSHMEVMSVRPPSPKINLFLWRYSLSKWMTLCSCSSPKHWVGVLDNVLLLAPIDSLSPSLEKLAFLLHLKSIHPFSLPPPHPKLPFSPTWMTGVTPDQSISTFSLIYSYTITCVTFLKPKSNHSTLGLA